MTQVLVVGHSDADGHVIAEQTRRNLASIPSFNVSVVVDPRRTYGHRSWTHLDQLTEVANAQLIVFVDLMFSPATFVGEAQALRRYVESWPDKIFYIVDHHPLPLSRLAAEPNLRATYRPDVFECTIGPKSGMMILAAIDEKQGETIAPFRHAYHDVLARGLKRSAAVGGTLPGPNLMALLEGDRWDLIHAIGLEPSPLHRLVRGRRMPNLPPSDALNTAERVAKEIRESNLNRKREGLTDLRGRTEPMPYDVALERYRPTGDEPPRYQNEPVPAKDLEILVTLLEVAAISLTTGPEATFTRDELIEEARRLGGEGIVIDEKDVRIILEKASFVTWTAGALRLR